MSILGYNTLINRLNLGLGSAVSVLIFLCVILIAFLFVKGSARTSPSNEGGALMRPATTGRTTRVLWALGTAWSLLYALDPGRRGSCPLSLKAPDKLNDGQVLPEADLTFENYRRRVQRGPAFPAALRNSIGIA